MANFIGIDLTASEKKPSATACLDEELRIVMLDKINADADLIRIVDRFSPAIIGIDSPLTLPLGWHCLEESHGCQPPSALKGRECERQLAKMGIPSYFVTTRCIIKEMVYRGIDLRLALAAKAYDVIEVYPYGSKVQLFGKHIPSKLTKAGLEFLKTRIEELIPDARGLREPLDHDLCDALIAAHTVYLHSRGSTFSVGSEEEGLVFLPKQGSKY